MAFSECPGDLERLATRRETDATDVPKNAPDGPKRELVNADWLKSMCRCNPGEM
jgi:hypothetical protein